ncbi:MAG: hypothetical protein LBM93_09520 [Oscillospiraceae bacterium]|nr:hypothetical protein [Oscillospiraceae bacterium]
MIVLILIVLIILVNTKLDNKKKGQIESEIKSYIFKTPNGLTDIVLAYYECNTHKKDSYYYLISGTGEVIIFDCTDRKLSLDYNTLNNKFKSEKVKAKLEISPNLEIYLNNIDIVEKEILSDFTESIFPKAEKRYEVVQQYYNEPDVYYLVPIWKVQYQAGLGKNPQVEFKCTSNYTDEICDYIDYAVNEAKKQLQ